MAITSILRDMPNNVSLVRIITTDTLATVTGADYIADQADNIASLNHGTWEWFETDILVVSCSDQNAILVFTDATFSTVEAIAEAGGGGGGVVLPTVANRIAYFTDTIGTISSDPANIVNIGNIVAGSTTVGGAFQAYSFIANTGSIFLGCRPNAGAFNVFISNASHAQTTAHAIPDPSNANSVFLVGAGVTPFVIGNFPVFSTTDGVVADSGVAATNIQNKTNIIAATTADIGGAGAGPISVAVAGLTTASVVVAVVESSSNPVSVIACTATNTGFDITFSADPGASCLVNYIAFIAAQ